MLQLQVYSNEIWEIECSIACTEDEDGGILPHVLTLACALTVDDLSCIIRLIMANIPISSPLLPIQTAGSPPSLSAPLLTAGFPPLCQLPSWLWDLPPLHQLPFWLLDLPPLHQFPFWLLDLPLSVSSPSDCRISSSPSTPSVATSLVVIHKFPLVCSWSSIT